MPAALGAWVTPKASILTIFIGGFLIFPLTQMMLLLFLAGILIARVVMAHYFSGKFRLGAWCAGLVLFVFAWIGRSIATGEASAPSTHLSA